MTDNLEQTREQMPDGLQVVSIDQDEMNRYQYLDKPIAEILDNEGVKNVMNKAVDASIHFIQKTLEDIQETPRMTLVIPPAGGVPFAMNILPKLSKHNPDLIGRLDIVYAFSHGSGEDKSMSVWRMNRGSVVPLTSGELENQPALMAEDIIDSIKTFQMAFGFFPDLFSIGAVCKGEGSDSELSTRQYLESELRSNIKNVPLGIIPEDLQNMMVKGPAIYSVLAVVQEWIQCCLGMDGASQAVRDLDVDVEFNLELLNKIFSKFELPNNVRPSSIVEVYERLCGIGINGLVNQDNLIDYLRVLAANVTDISQEDFTAYLNIIDENKTRKLNELHKQDERIPTDVYSIVRQLNLVFSKFVPSLKLEEP